MKLSAWAKEQGVSYRTALNWFHAGTLPVPARQLPTGTILVDPPQANTAAVVAYCRVSSRDQKADLERQAGRVLTGASGRGLRIDRTVTEIGSGLNGRRVKLRKLLADPTVGTIVVEHRDRLARFGVEYLEAAMAATGRAIVVLDETEVHDDLVRDMIEILTAMCARLYGRRSAARRAEAAVRAAQTDPGGES
ncbi:integrase [Nocardia sp. FDAARGOS_372]|uniref:IS607 family transposase n=1 Tax=Nocardia sp. FDAARGOS_372 TaxID=2018066 RepID=UPI000BEF37C1|nr:IS607 family transposase [Nocardia sp. FDAARGOS_372]PEH74622.1 integrase [Nocardia sp. FDAARGOS_372]